MESASLAEESWRLYRQESGQLNLIRDFESLCEAAQCIADIEVLETRDLTLEIAVPLDFKRFGEEPFQLFYRGKRARYFVVRDKINSAASAARTGLS